MPQSPVAHVFAEEWPKLVAVLVRDLGDVGLAEDSVGDAFVEAAQRWGPNGLPSKPGAWLLTTARRKAIDHLRRAQRFDERLPALLAAIELEVEPTPFGDDQLALIFGCCHPALNPDAQVALTLREVCGLSVPQIASSYLVSDEAMARRLSRAKAKIRAANIPFERPDRDGLTARLPAVLSTIYLIFTQGHVSSNGASLIRGDLCDEASWLADLVSSLLPEQPEAAGLAALIGFVDARRSARLDTAGRLIVLDRQDRSLWNHDRIAEATDMLGAALAQQAIGPYQVQALIAATHSRAPDGAATDWKGLVGLYDLLVAMIPSAVVRLNRAVAISRAEGAAAGLALLDDADLADALIEYHYFHAARADLLAELGETDAAIAAYDAALILCDNDAERDFLTSKRRGLESGR